MQVNMGDIELFWGDICGFFCPPQMLNILSTFSCVIVMAPALKGFHVSLSSSTCPFIFCTMLCHGASFSEKQISLVHRTHLRLT